MSGAGKISVRPLNELVSDSLSIEETPKHIREKKRKAATTSKKKINVETSGTLTGIATTEAKKPRFSRKDPLPGQLFIDTFYKSAAKTYTIQKTTNEKSIARTCITPKKPKRRRKALFKDDDSTTTTSDDKNLVFHSRKTKLKAESFIDLCSESETEEKQLEQRLNGNGHKNYKNVLSVLSPAQNERVSLSVAFEASLKTIDEVVAIQETIASDLCQTKLGKEDAKSPVQLKISMLDTMQKEITTPKKNEMRNSDEWFQKRCKKSPRITSTSHGTSKEASCLEVNNNVQSKTRRQCTSAKKSKNCNATNLNQSKESVPEQSKCSNFRSKSKRILEKSLNQKSVDVEPLCFHTDTKKNVNLKGRILAPSDLHTSPQKKYATEGCTDSNIKQESTKPPTPPDSTRRSSISADAHVKMEKLDVLLERSCSAGVVAISDEEQENVKIPNSAIKPKAKKRGKRTGKTPKIESKKITKAPRPCPTYKVVEGTTFAVDAFRYGDIEGVTHYFLTHFHADHYIGLNRQFAHPLYMTPITARLVRVFIPIDEQYIKELSLDTPITIGDVEVTAIDANHCPGAAMFIFKTRDGKCILHTGDFRACPEMESEPIFWNNDIHTIYLDTTYFPKKYAFCSQSDSIDRALHIIEEFHEKNVGTRILYVCGSYLIGKEKFWSAIAHKFSLKVWTDGNRKKALNAVNDENIIRLLVDDPCDAHMHVIPMVHLSYFTLLEYIEKYSKHFDILFALRPSGWEKNSKPQFRGKVNIVGIEYSEHSSHDELKRFVQYLKPQKVISTVPVSNDAMKIAKIPDNWYKYDTLSGLQRQFQPAITSYFKMKSGNASSKKTPPAEQKHTLKSSGHISEMIISPLEKCNSAVSAEEHQKVKEKLKIADSEGDDDWLT